MTTTDRIVDRFRCKRIATRFAAMDDTKMEALLQKIRKGATASLNWSQLGEVFQVLTPGWKLEKTTGFIKLHGRLDNDGPAMRWVPNDDVGLKKHRKYKDAFVSSLPGTAKPGKLYVTELSELKPARHGGDNELEFTFKGYWGNDAWRIVTPAGQEMLVMPDKHDIGDGSVNPKSYKTVKHGKINLYEVIPWLKKETTFIADVNAKLGMDAHEVVVRTRDGTGTCPACFQNVKVTNGRDIVLHGYKRPGHGSVEGNCFGYKFPAFELSDKGSKAFLDEKLEPSLKDSEDFLKRLKGGKVKELMGSSGKVISEGAPEWERTLQSRVDSTQNEVDYLETMVKAFKELVAKWKEHPLPKEGERKIDWFTEGRK